MAVAKGDREYKYQKSFVKVFHVNYEDMEKELNDWVKNNEEKYEIVDINFSIDCQDRVVVMVVCKHILVN